MAITAILVEACRRISIWATEFLPSGVTYPPTPTTFEDLIQFNLPRGMISKHRFVVAEKRFELQIGRNTDNIVWLEFSAPDPPWQYWSCVRRVESLTSRRDVWSHWQKFMEDPDSYLTWKYIGMGVYWQFDSLTLSLTLRTIGYQFTVTSPHQQRLPCP